MIERHITEAVLAALRDTPVVLLHGPRQSGKSTLARGIAENQHKAAYFTLDDAALLSAASRDPDAFLRATSGPVVIDEVQLAPDLFRAIKIEVDRHRTPGRFLLTGSANVLLLPKLSESLAGRMEILTLWPFSEGELRGVREDFVERLFETDDFAALPAPEVPRPELLRRIVAGGYPEVAPRLARSRRAAWFGSYITTILQRDVREMADNSHVWQDTIRLITDGRVRRAARRRRPSHQWLAAAGLSRMTRRTLSGVPATPPQRLPRRRCDALSVRC